jgi:hypothetical protein
LGNEQTKKIHLRHGAIEPLFGVKVGDLKAIQKKVKKITLSLLSSMPQGTWTRCILQV